MTTVVCSFDRLSNDDLLIEIKRLARCERKATATLIASLMELDARRLYLAEGCSSLFTYCTEVLHLSEHAAFGRIRAARAAHEFPLILELLVAGEIHLTTVTLLAAHLTHENHVAVLTEARHKGKRQLEELAARLAPQPDVAATIRRLPEKSAPAASSNVADIVPALPAPEVPLQVAAPTPQPTPQLSSAGAPVAPLAPERYKVQFTVSKETHDKLRRVQDLLRHSVPTGDPAVIFDKALTLLLAQIERTKLAATEKLRVPRPARSSGSRHIPAQSGERYGSETAVAVRLSARMVDAPKPDTSSFTMSSRLPKVVRPPQRIWSYAVEHSINSRLTGGSARGCQCPPASRGSNSDRAWATRSGPS